MESQIVQTNKRHKEVLKAIKNEKKNLLIIFISSLLIICSETIIKPSRERFLKYKYVERFNLDIHKEFKKDTVPFIFVLVIVAILPIFAFIGYMIVYLVKEKNKNRKKVNNDSEKNSNEFINKLTESPTSLNNPKKIFNILTFYFSALLTKTLIVNILKMTICEPRPDFVERCKPFSINNVQLLSNKEKDINFNLKRIYMGLTSFPSGHTSSSFLFYLFIAYYLKKFFLNQFDKKNFYFNIFVITTFWLPFFVGYTRYLDNKHHIHDIIGGALVGALVFIIFSYGRRKNK